MKNIILIILILGQSFNILGQNDKIESKFLKAAQFSNEKQYHKAIKYYKKVLRKDSENYAALVNLGVCYYDIADFQKAIDTYNLAEKLENRKGTMYNNRANAYSRLGQYENAISDLKKALELKGSLTDTFGYNIANNYWRWGKLDSALLYFDKVIKINPGLTQTYTNKAFVYILKEEYEMARLEIQNALLLDSTNFNNLNNLGYVFLKLNDLANASKYVYKSLEYNPNNSWAYRNLGLISKEKGNSAEACKFLTKALKLDFIKYWGAKDIQELIDYCN